MEVGVGACLSQDKELLAAYESGDAHMHLAKASGMVPQDATKDRAKTPYPFEEYAKHCEIRAQFKTCDLAAMYGATSVALMKKGLTKEMARTTLQFHHRVYSQFWEWIDDRIEHADIDGVAQTLGGWQIKVDAEERGFNQRSVGNFFVQANSAEIMRLAAILAVERGLGICAVVHDAFLLEAPIEDMPRQVAALKDCMDIASRVFLDGFVLGIDGDTPDKWIVYPNRYIDDRGESFWSEVVDSLTRLESPASLVTSDMIPITQAAVSHPALAHPAGLRESDVYL